MQFINAVTAGLAPDIQNARRFWSSVSKMQLKSCSLVGSGRFWTCSSAGWVLCSDPSLPVRLWPSGGSETNLAHAECSQMLGSHFPLSRNAHWVCHLSQHHTHTLTPTHPHTHWHISHRGRREGMLPVYYSFFFFFVHLLDSDWAQPTRSPRQPVH